MAHALVRRKEVQGWRGEILDGEVLADRVFLARVLLARVHGGVLLIGHCSPR
jgi:hypothetical protein